MFRHRVRHESPQLGILLLQRLQPRGLADVQTAKPGFSFVNGRIADSMFAAQIGNGNAGLMFLQNADDLLFGASRLLHL